MKYEFEVGYDRITNFDAPGYVPKEISTFLTRAQEDIAHEVLDDLSANDEKNRKAMSRLRQVIPLTTFVAGNYPNGYITTLQLRLDSGPLGSISFSGTNTITDTLSRFVTTGFRVGDLITVSGTTSNNKTFHVTGVAASTLTVSSQVPTVLEIAATDVTFVADQVLRVRNERADIALGSTNFYYDRIAGNAITDVEVDPVDDDFYSANKDNPYKKPSEKKIWRIDGADESSKEHEYITDGTFTLTTVHLHIDRKPRAIIVPETTSLPYAVSDGTIDGIYFVDYSTGLDCLLDSTIHREIVDKAVKLAYAALQDQTGFQISSVQEQQE